MKLFEPTSLDPQAATLAGHFIMKLLLELPSAIRFYINTPGAIIQTLHFCYKLQISLNVMGAFRL